MTASQDLLNTTSPEKLDIRNAILTLRNSKEYQELCKRYTAQTVFNILRIARDENVHSDFLAWLLDPASDHGLGDFTLRKFLEMLVRILRETKQSERAAALFPIDVVDSLIAGNYSISEVEVKREAGTASKRRMDIVLKFRLECATGVRRFLVVLENKVYSGENKEQTVDYWKWATMQAHGEPTSGGSPEPTSVVGVYLTPLAETEFRILCRCQCKCENFIQANYQSLMDHVLVHVLGRDIKTEARFLIEQYARNLSYPCSLARLTSGEITKGDIIMAIPPNERAILKDFYTANKALLLAVLTALKDDAEPEVQDGFAQVIAAESGTRKPSDKPVSIQFGEEPPKPASSWKEVFLVGLNLAMDNGTAPEDLPVGYVSKNREDYNVAMEIRDGYFIESQLGMKPILRLVDKALAKAKVPPNFVKVTTKAGNIELLPKKLT